MQFMSKFNFFGEKSAISHLKWEEVTDSPRPSALCLSLFFTDVCLFVHKYIELSVGVRLLAGTNTTSSAKPSVSRTQPDNSLVGWAHHPCLQLLPVNNKLAEDTHGSKCLQFQSLRGLNLKFSQNIKLIESKLTITMNNVH